MMKSKNNISTNWSLAFGHIVQCFDNTLYGFFAILLAPIFFPTSDLTVQITLSFEAFAAGFIARPLGSLVFGLIGDSKARSTALTSCIGLIGVPTLIIGLLPTYHVIGVWAPICLVICRVFQGFFFGGEFAGANLCLFEKTKPQFLGRNTSILTTVGVLGAILAALTGFIVTLPQQPIWAWRVPFILGGCTALIAFVWRKKSILFEDRHQTTSLNLPFYQVIKNILAHYKIKVLLSMLMSGLTVVPLYLATFYANKVFKELGFSYAQSMLFNIFALMCNAFFIMCYGRVADRLGFNRLIKWGCISNIIVAIPAFLLLMTTSQSTLMIIGFIALLICSGCIINGCTMPYIAQLFAYNIRYTGVAISHGLGISIFGGMTPVIAVYFKNVCQSDLGPSLYMIILSISVLVLKKIMDTTQST